MNRKLKQNLTPRTDKERIDSLEKSGAGIALLHDDCRHWYVVGSGMQSIPGKRAAPFTTSYFVMEEDVHKAGKSVREAIDRWLDDDQSY